MIQIRKSKERGHATHGWLDTYHSFSFADYYDPKHMGFRSLRVINEDRIAPGKGFGAHPHQNMEILTYVLNGQLAHKDSMGHKEVLGPNEIQRMSAGTGVVHSEFNASATEPVHLFQIWLQPATNSTPASYEQLGFAPEEKQGKLRLLASPEGGDGAARINQDVKLFVAELEPGKEISYPLGQERHAWVQVVRGTVSVNGDTLQGGDAAALSKEADLKLTAVGTETSEVLLFDLA